MQRETLVELDAIESAYDSGFHLGPICMTLKKGDFASLIGPNGSGKSTLFKALSCDIPLIKGGITMGNTPLSSLSRVEKAQKIAIVMTGERFPDIKVSEMVLMGRTPYQTGLCLSYSKQDRDIAQEAMLSTGVFPLRDYRVSQLSAGQQQLVSVATALAQRPQLLLLDEATAHLDITHQIRLMNLLQEMNEKEGLTILMILHDLNLASEYCNRLFLMNGGRIEREGTPSEVLHYEILERVYQTPIIVSENPLSHFPFVLPVSARVMKMKGIGE